MARHPDLEKTVARVAKSIDELADALDQLHADAKRAEVDQARVNAQLEVTLDMLKGLVPTVSGDHGLLARVSVLEDRVAAIKEELAAGHYSLAPLIDPIRAELEDVKDGLDALQKGEVKKLRAQLEDNKEDRRSGTKRVTNIIGTVFAGLAILVTVALFVLNNCDLK